MARKGAGTVSKVKYEEMILSEVNQILRSKLNDSRLQFVSVIKVDLSNDYSHAKLFWDSFDLERKAEIQKAVDSSASKIRAILSKTLTVRQVPALHFHYDGQFEAQNAIEGILASEAKEGKGF